MAHLYWIKHESLSNPYNEGYVGVTTSKLDRRLHGHYRQPTNTHMAHALAKYDVTIHSLFEGSIQECVELEKQYRPARFIGWNNAKGGGLPPICTVEVGKKISATLKRKGANPFCAATVSPEAIAKRAAINTGRRMYLKDGLRKMFRPGTEPSGWVPNNPQH